MLDVYSVAKYNWLHTVLLGSYCIYVHICCAMVTMSLTYMHVCKAVARSLMCVGTDVYLDS